MNTTGGLNVVLTPSDSSTLNQVVGVSHSNLVGIIKNLFKELELMVEDKRA